VASAKDYSQENGLFDGASRLDPRRVALLAQLRGTD
jgi:hypothetical protein